VRLFVALELPGDVRGALAAWGEHVAAADRALRPVAEEALHLTLAFLGERPAEEAEALRAVVRGAAAPVARLSLGEALWLAPRRPHVLTVAIGDGDGALGEVQARVVRALGQAIGFRAEARAFHPHVTVARVRRGERPRRGRLPALPEVSPAVFAGEALTLMRSLLGRGPARYEALERVSLRA
jgi:2'-5' RNA ligase